MVLIVGASAPIADSIGFDKVDLLRLCSDEFGDGRSGSDWQVTFVMPTARQ